MMDAASQTRFARGCAEAAAGYATAATAAYTDFASQALDFWCTAMSGFAAPEPAANDNSSSLSAFGSSRATAPRPARQPEPAFGLSLADWCPFPWLDPRRYERMLELDTTTTPLMAMFAFANVVPLRGCSKSWPFAQAMIESGVPRAVAWPAAEANAAMLDAADAASKPLQRVFASYHTENGFATSARSMASSFAALLFVFGVSGGALEPGAGWFNILAA